MTYPAAPWYGRILLPMVFGRLLLQSYCGDPCSPIPVIHAEYERGGINQEKVGRNTSFVIAYALKNLREIANIPKNVSKILFYDGASS